MAVLLRFKTRSALPATCTASSSFMLRELLFPHSLLPKEASNAHCRIVHNSAYQQLASKETARCAAGGLWLQGENSCSALHAFACHSFRLPCGARLVQRQASSNAHHGRGENAGNIHPLDRTLNHFQLLGIPDMQFNLDPKELEQCYKKLQWQYHPDKASLWPREEQEWAADHATAINHAYGILKDPLSRATYMLAQLGINVDGEDAGTISDPELLMEIMEAREEVEQTSDVVQLHQWLSRIRRKKDGLVSKLDICFQQNDPQAAKDVATELIYVDRIEVAILEKLPTAA